MVFSSQIFLYYFLPLALAAYYVSPQAARHTTLTLLSYLFYGWWNPAFVFLMLFSTAVDYFCGKVAGDSKHRSTRARRSAVLVSVITNLSLLGFFKYFGFFQQNTNSLLTLFGQDPMPVFAVILPVGISFYTFQSMSYTIDIYRGMARPARSFIDFACYVSLFPQLVAGPIIRYNTLDEQLRARRHSWEDFSIGAARFMLGFAKKVLLANPMAVIADRCFAAGDGSLTTAMAWVGIVAYAFQIYFDFSGYSDMAIGLGRMFGFRFPENFCSPYRATSMTDFWRRWHISLSTFLRDYLYIPLGGNRKGAMRTYINLFLVMLIGGFWHGASWNFVIWGAFHGLLLAGERLRGKSSPYEFLPKPCQMMFTFVLVLFAWVFFRAENLEVATGYFRALFGLSETGPQALILQAELLLQSPWNIFMLTLCAFITWGMPRTEQIVERVNLWKGALIIVLFVISQIALVSQGYNPFIYFQF